MTLVTAKKQKLLYCARVHARESVLEGLDILEGLEILERLVTLERLAFACGELLEEIGILRFQFCDDSI